MLVGWKFAGGEGITQKSSAFGTIVIHGDPCFDSNVLLQHSGQLIIIVIIIVGNTSVNFQVGNSPLVGKETQLPIHATRYPSGKP